MTRRRRMLINGALVVALVLTAGGTWWFLRPAEAAAQADGESVRSATASVGTVSTTIAAQGNIESAAVTDVSFSTSGSVASVDVAVGTVVEAGAVLGTLDPATAAAAVTAAQADAAAATSGVTAAGLQVTSATENLTEAQAALADASTTSESDSVPASGSSTASSSGSSSGSASGSASQVTSARAQVTTAKASLTKAQAELTAAQAALTEAQAATSLTTLVAPVAGTVTAVNSAVGDSVSAGSTGSSSTASTSSAAGATTGTTDAAVTGGSSFVTISSTTSLQVSASFDEADAAQLVVGQRADVTFPAVEGATAAATVTAIDPVGTATSSVVTFGATITLDAAPAGIRLGQTASLTVTTAEAVDVIAVPSQAVTVDASPTTDAAGVQTVTGTVTLLAADGTQTEQAVTVGVQGDSMTQILTGLAEGDAVVISVDTSVGTTEEATFGGTAPSGGFPGGTGSFPGGTGGAPQMGGTR